MSEPLRQTTSKFRDIFEARRKELSVSKTAVDNAAGIGQKAFARLTWTTEPKLTCGNTERLASSMYLDIIAVYSDGELNLTQKDISLPGLLIYEYEKIPVKMDVMDRKNTKRMYNVKKYGSESGLDFVVDLLKILGIELKLQPAAIC
jgi:hypothetical protein